MHPAPSLRSSLAPVLLAAGLAAASTTSLHAAFAFEITNLVSDVPGLAANTDPRLVNPWGISSSATSAFWVSNQGTDTSTLYNTAGTPQALVVSLPNPGGGSLSPTGQVFNAGAAFNADRFIFATLEGKISGWRGPLGTNAEVLFDNSSANAVYTGLGIGTTSGSTFLYASDFRNNRIDVFGAGGLTTLAGGFIDAGLPSGYSAYNVQNLGGSLFVTYARPNPSGPGVLGGLGTGYVSEFDLNGNFLRRFATTGPLDAPWGLSIAPTGFGDYAGHLLVGNFGDGHINVYNRTTGAFIDALRGINGQALSIDGLWGLIPGNGGAGGALDKLYFAAGINGETHGLFGSISATPVPEPSTVFSAAFLALFAGASYWTRRRRQARA